MANGGKRSAVRAGQVAVLALSLAAISTPASALASPYVHAHRGGAFATVSGEQVPVFGEATMPAFRNAVRRGFVVELDAQVSADGVPFAIHDAELDRTTNCEGLVSEMPAAEIRRQCRVDVLGRGDEAVKLAAASTKLAKVPPLKQVLRLASRRGAELNLEIKNDPTEPDFDPGDSTARAVADEIERSGFPPSRLIVQSFWPPNIDVIEADPDLALAETSLLTLGSLNAGGPALAAERGYEWFSPQWPIDASLLAEAHSRGLRVVPYTLNSGAELTAAVER
ncbi:MAG: glycerophosphodiester phosphodiesterase, partial [Solirubrobacterales bacterium]